jgi:uncharacterized protein with predicted RNA binding PUA domain
MKIFDKRRQVGLIIDYNFGRGVSRALPKRNLRITYSSKSGRVKQVFFGRRLFATVKVKGAFALTVYGASVLLKSGRFRDNCVVVDDDAAQFVKVGKSVFCKFVKSAGRNIHAGGEVAVLDSVGRVVGVGRAIMSGVFMREFKSGMAVKVREGTG